MLFNQETLDRIRTGDVTLAFRQWRRPSVKAGGTLLTSVGLLAIDAVDAIALSEIKPREAARAGFRSVADARANLEKQRPGQLFRIRFRVAGPDPRVALRLKAALAAHEVASLDDQLKRLDQRAPNGPWTRRILRLIARHPEQSAGELARISGYTKEWLKLNVRKLKNLGLTESLNPGYRLSPRGEAYWRVAGSVER